MSPVEFMIAGAQKCGTTALDGYLRQHPRIVMPIDKEAHFFDREENFGWRDPDYSGLDASYDASRTGKRGEATPVTLYWTPAHYRILRYNPDMRFIVLVRPPAERAFSHWKMNRRNALDPLPFSEAIRAGRQRVLDGGGPRVRPGSGPSGLHRIFSYVERGFYGRQIEQLGRLFGMDRTLVLTQADLQSDPQGLLAGVARFLDVEPFAPVTETRLNVSDTDGATMDPADRAYLDTVFADDIAFLKTLTGVDLANPPGVTSSPEPAGLP